MIRCIEEAIKDGAVTREEGRRLQERVDELLDQGLGGADVRARLSQSLAADAKQAKRRALLQEARRQVLTDIVLNHKNAKGENDPAQALWLVLDNTAMLGSLKDVERTRLAIIQDAHRLLHDVLHEFRRGLVFGDRKRLGEAEQASMRDFLKELHGEDSGSARAKQLADAWRQTAELLRLRANKAGMAIGNLEIWGMPQVHNREALLAGGREQWVEYLMQPGRLDRERMAAHLERSTYTDDELREALRAAWVTITSDGAIDRNPSLGLGKGPLAKRFDGKHRWMHFASADEWWAYQKQFGEGDPFRTMMQHVNLMARDIAALEVLGPNPEAMRGYLKALVQKTAAIQQPLEQVLADNMLRLRQMVAASGAGEAGGDALARVERELLALARLKRAERAGGALRDASVVERMRETDLQKGAVEREIDPKAVAEDVDALKAGRDRIGEDVAKVTDELRRVIDLQRERDNIITSLGDIERQASLRRQEATLAGGLTRLRQLDGIRKADPDRFPAEAPVVGGISAKTLDERLARAEADIERVRKAIDPSISLLKGDELRSREDAIDAELKGLGDEHQYVAEIKALRDELVLQQAEAEKRVGAVERQRALQARISDLDARLEALRDELAVSPERVKAGEQKLREAIRDLGNLESAATTERRAVLEAEVGRLDGIIDGIVQRGPAPGQKINVPARNRARVAQLAEIERGLDERLAKAELSPAEQQRIDRVRAMIRSDDARVLEPADVVQAFGLSDDTRLVARLERIRRGFGERYRQFAEQWFADDGQFWMPRGVRDRLLEIKDMPGMAAYLDQLARGGLERERMGTLQRLKDAIARERKELVSPSPLVETALSRRNQRRVEELSREREAVRRQLEGIDETRTTLETHDPGGWRRMLALIRQTEAHANTIDVVGEADAFLSVRKPQDAARVAIDKHDRLWELSRGTYFVPINKGWADALQTGRNLVTAHMLGSASITAIADLSTQRVAQKIAGMDGNMLSIVRGVFSQWGSATRAEAARASLGIDEALHVAGQEARFLEGINTVHWSGYVADRVLVASGLSWLTQAGKHYFGFAFQGHVADRLHLTFDELAKADPALERLLRRSGMSYTDWEMMRASQVHEPRPGVRLLRPGDIEAGPGGRDLAEKYLATIISMTRKAVVEGTPEARIMWGGGRPGTFIGEVSRNMAQFRSYSAGYLMLHLRDAMYTAQAGRKYDAAMHIANLIAVGTLLGALAIDLNQLTGGNDPIFASMLAQGQMPSGQKWGEAFLKSGGLGVYGDFLFASTHFLSKGAVEVLAGPLTGQAERSRRQLMVEVEDLAGGKPDAVGLARWAYGTARSFAPGTTIWWLKKPLNALALDNLERIISPERAQKSWQMSERMRRKNGPVGQSWWDRGDLGPKRLPSMMTPMVGGAR